MTCLYVFASLTFFPFLWINILYGSLILEVYDNRHTLNPRLSVLVSRYPSPMEDLLQAHGKAFGIWSLGLANIQEKLLQRFRAKRRDLMRNKRHQS